MERVSGISIADNRQYARIQGEVRPREQVCTGWVRQFRGRVRAWEHTEYVIFSSVVGNFYLWYLLSANREPGYF